MHATNVIQEDSLVDIDGADQVINYYYITRNLKEIVLGLLTQEWLN